jgi:hypothetical protein
MTPLDVCLLSLWQVASHWLHLRSCEPRRLSRKL